ncbi:Ig-like domain-containing protein [Cellulomonas sp. HZM]|uniref:Ig-like domain-containing protein n=1 Tax=Cellulomonas sp. HZM TaxID=1454010 RepID=UPI000493B2CE|nr:Ig-like domain-containing protein [Cellulomonas sp. HZM]
MSTSHLRRRVAGIVVAALATAPLVALTAPTAGAAPGSPAITSSVDFDYLADVFPALASQRGEHVFEPIGIERLKYLLRFKAGKYAVLVGDPKDPSIQAEIGYINDAAKSIGVRKIYVFDPRIDGNDLNIFDWDELGTHLTGAGLTYWKNEGVAATTGGPLIDLINGNSPTPEFVRTDGKVSGPYLVVLDKDRKDADGFDDRVVSSLAGTSTPADLDTPAEQAAYEATVKQTLLDGGTVASPDLAVSTQLEFYKDEVNRRHTSSYTDATKYGGDILSDADGTDGWRIQQLTYPEAIDLLSNPRYAGSDVPLLFGGTWCHNTRAVIGHINADAQASGIKTVYNLDFSLFSAGNGGTTYDHIRTSGTPAVTDGKTLAPGYLYGDLVNTYLPNAVAEYAKAGEPGASPNWYYPGGDTTGTLQSARRLQVPALLVYSQDHKDALGNPAPVVDEAIRTNDDGTYTEYMTENWYVAGHALPNTPDTTLNGTLAAGGDRLTNARDFASEALDAYADVLGSLGSTRYTSTTSVTVDGAQSTDLVPGTTPTLAVKVTAAGYAPFITNNKSAADVPRSTATGSPAGSVVVLDQDGHQVGAPVALKRDGSAVSITLPAITSDQIGDVWSVRYLGRGYSIGASSADLRVGKRSTVTLAGAASASFGTAVTYTATVSAGATGTVQLTGLPGGARTATVVGGTATFTAPATLAAGSYTLTAAYSGDAVFASSSSAPVRLTIARLGTKATVSAPTSTTYGKAAKITVKVVDARGKAVSGKVTLAGAGPTVTATLAAGQAVVTLPASLAVRSYTLKAAYAGTADVAGSSATATLKVAQGKVSKVTTKVTTRPTSKKKGKATVTVTAPKGLATASGKVTVTLTKGSKKVVKTVTLRSGKATVALPKLAKGTWKVSARYAGSTTYAAASATTVKIAVKK